MKEVVGCIVAVIVVGSMVGAQGKTDPALDKIAQEFADTFNKKDAAKLASFYTEDAVLMPANRPMVKGRPAIEADFKKAFEMGVTNLQLRPMESRVAGEQAFEAGTSTVTIKGSGGVMTEQGKYVVVYKRVGKDWRIAYDSFSGDQPPPPMK